MGAQGWPRVSKMTPQILPKFVENRGPGPGAHPKGAKGTPGPPKMSKIGRKWACPRVHPSQKIRGSNAPHETSSEKGSRTLAAYIEQLSGHNSTAHTWSRGTSKKHCLSLELDD